MTDASATYVIYVAGAPHTVSLAELELWPQIPAELHPQRFFYDGERDFRIVFLESGFARLRNPDTADAQLRTAEAYAKAHALGMWAPQAVPTVTTATTDTVTTTQTAPPEPATVNVPTAPRRPWRGWEIIGVSGATDALSKLWQGIAFLVGAFGLYELWGMFWRWRRRFRIDLIMVGPLDVGKSWLWARVINPDITEEELRTIKRTLAPHERSLPPTPGPLQAGHYVIKPRWRDIPGSQLGHQLASLIDQRRFWWLQHVLIPQKRIWIIFLSPNAKATVNASSPMTEKLDHDHMIEQFGSLALYEGALRLRRTHPPNLVIIAITKVDLFTDEDPDTRAGQSSAVEVRKYFSGQVRRIQSVCEELHIDTAVILTSALRGWGVRQIVDAISRAFFPRARP